MVQIDYCRLGGQTMTGYAFFVKIWNAAVSGSRQDRL